MERAPHRDTRAVDSARAMVIVGAGQAGAWAARTLRQAGHAGRIVLLGAEAHAPYERPPLSKGLLDGTQDAAQATLLSPEQIASLDIAFLPGARVVAIDRTARRVHCRDGRAFAYDRLLLATGGRPRLPRVPGLDAAGVHVLRTMDDALALRDALSARPCLAVVGGGWIGLECAATARRLGCPVTLLEAGPRLCARSVMPEVSAHLGRLHRDAGVDLRLNARLQCVHAMPDGRLRLLLDDGGAIQADRVIVGAGMAANDELARSAGLDCAQGVCVDAACRTSDPHIYAAGDVAVLNGAAGAVRLESWQNAQDQGMAAARAMLGQEVDYRPIPFVWSEQYGSLIQIAGHPALSRRTVQRAAGARGALYVGLDASGTVTAAIGIGAGRDFRLARKWVETASPPPDGFEPCGGSGMDAALMKAQPA
jgi:3-phenylpropionate/trans-cinnamate dioxygenase ferredoxin reductase subunit